MLLDTSGILCYHHTDETRHEDAQVLFEAAGAKLVHSYVLAEFVALAHVRKLPRLPAPSFLATLIQHPDVEVVWVNEILRSMSSTMHGGTPLRAWASTRGYCAPICEVDKEGAGIFGFRERLRRVEPAMPDFYRRKGRKVGWRVDSASMPHASADLGASR